MFCRVFFFSFLTLALCFVGRALLFVPVYAGAVMKSYALVWILQYLRLPMTSPGHAGQSLTFGDNTGFDRFAKAPILLGVPAASALSGGYRAIGLRSGLEGPAGGGALRFGGRTSGPEFVLLF